MRHGSVPLIHASLTLYRALALRLRTPTAMSLIDNQLVEITQDGMSPTGGSAPSRNED